MLRQLFAPTRSRCSITPVSGQSVSGRSVSFVTARIAQGMHENRLLRDPNVVSIGVVERKEQDFGLQIGVLDLNTDAMKTLPQHLVLPLSDTKVEVEYRVVAPVYAQNPEGLLV